MWYAWGMNESQVALIDDGPRARYMFRKDSGPSSNGSFHCAAEVGPDRLKRWMEVILKVAGTFPTLDAFEEWLTGANELTQTVASLVVCAPGKAKNPIAILREVWDEGQNA